MENSSDQNNQNYLPPPPPPRRLFNPYESLQQPNLPNIPSQILDSKNLFLFHEESGPQRRSYGESIQYYTGSMYLTGAILGGAKGSVEGIMAAERSDTTKIRVNRILNAGGHVGRKYGNSLGVLGFMFGVMEGGIIYCRNGEDGISSTVLAGLGAGAVYKIASGPRSAALAGAIVGLAAAGAVAAKQAVWPVIKRYVPI
ncbi:Mitochondrial import inner membrane translocase subunit tim23-3 [Thalictrum thalictroides]|uniref:Mitochondrial import inner membrane translocase subunit tim23-3 n=1 Tax=Thalictrum thalictroides TaxID=46969 RepID=A0A7J6WR44_THATH|nr:Mitochondrial import inner membrane translocase subunit tim23-3 [Thalictrum thalictroides]